MVHMDTSDLLAEIIYSTPESIDDRVRKALYKKQQRVVEYFRQELKDRGPTQ